MKGENKLVLSQEAMVEAMQVYMQKLLITNVPTVTQVTYNRTTKEYNVYLKG